MTVAVDVPSARDAGASIVACPFAHELGIGQGQVEGPRDRAQHQIRGTGIVTPFVVAERTDQQVIVPVGVHVARARAPEREVATLLAHERGIATGASTR